MDMLPISTATGEIAILVIAALIGFLLWSKRTTSPSFFLGGLAGTGLWILGLHYLPNAQLHVVRAFTLFPVNTAVGQIAVLTVAVAVLVAFLLWSKRAASDSFFLGILTGTGFVFSFDIVWVHWIFGLHHLTNSELDLILEPLLVLAGLGFMWFGITGERRHG